MNSFQLMWFLLWAKVRGTLPRTPPTPSSPIENGSIPVFLTDSSLHEKDYRCAWERRRKPYRRQIRQPLFLRLQAGGHSETKAFARAAGGKTPANHRGVACVKETILSVGKLAPRGHFPDARDHLLSVRLTDLFRVKAAA